MGEPIFVDITDRAHAAAINRWIGQIDAQASLEEKAKEFDRLPGFGLALAILRKETAESQSRAVMANLRAIAKAGIDVGETRTVELETKAKGSLRLKVTMMDLADIAEAGSNG